MRNVGRVLVGVIALALCLQSETGYKILTRYPVPGNGSFDYVTFDPAVRRIYISHGTEVNVIEAGSGKLVGTIPDTPVVHGAIPTPFKHGFTSNGAEHKVSMFDLATLALIKKIDVGRGPDGIYYEPTTKRVFTNNHGSHDITALDAATGDVIGTVKIEGDGEEAIIGKDGMIYVNSENTNEVVVFDPKSLEVKKRFPIEVAKTPTGLAYDAKTNRLFIGSRNQPKMVVMDAVFGKVITSFPIGKGVDFAAFDPQAKLVFFSCGEGVLSVFHEKGADDYEDDGSVKTQPSARTMAFDPKTSKIFLSAAEFVEAPAATPGGRPPRSIKHDSFVVMVVSK